MEALETIEYKGYTIEIHADTDIEDPRKSFDHAGTLCLFHKRYNFPNESGKDIKELMELVKDENVYSLNVYAYEHGGITIRCAPFSDPWDSGQLGVIYITKENFEKEQGKGLTAKDVHTFLKAEIEEYDNYLTGNVWGYVVKLGDDEIDSCWGFYGDHKYVVEEAKSIIDWHVKEDQKTLSCLAL